MNSLRNCEEELESIEVLLLDSDLSSDEEEFLLERYDYVSEEKERFSAPRPRFTASSFRSLRESSLVFFRFTEQDVYLLLNKLEFPSHFITTKNRYRASGLEGLCILLRRLAYPSRLADLLRVFGRSSPELSEIFLEVQEFVYSKWCRLLDFKPQHFQHWLPNLAEVVERKGSPFDNLVGFIDGTGRPICRPSRQQKAFYSGHHRRHELKYQGIVLANGLLFVFGPVNGSRHDMHMLRQSGLLEAFPQMKSGDRQFILFGDAGYASCEYIKTPRRRPATREDRHFNLVTSRLRQPVEWAFKDVSSNFSILDMRPQQVVLKSPIAQSYLVACFLTNCKACILGYNQTSLYFQTAPPSLDEYLALYVDRR